MRAHRFMACLLALCPLLLPAQEDLAQEDLVQEDQVQEDLGPSARAELAKFTSGLESLHAQFRQTLTSAEGELMESGTGEVWMQRPDRFRWQHAGEFPELIVADGERLWMYDEALEQVTVREQSGQPEDSPLLLLTEPEGIDRQFIVTELGDIGEMLLLELKVRNAQAEFERVLLGLRDGQLRMMTMEDAFGMRTEIRFEQVERNPQLDPELFRFTPPTGVDVLGGDAEEAP